jgi:hypothetical protein
MQPSACQSFADGNETPELALVYKCVDVDHFNPKLKGAARNNYLNLFPSTRHCNGSKSDHWPSAVSRKMGVRFLNPCNEVDYGVHIFEDPLTHQLIGKSPAGVYHIRYCDLNAPHLILERRDRFKLRELLNECAVTSKVPASTLTGGKMLDVTDLLRSIVEKMILPIPPPPRS